MSVAEWLVLVLILAAALIALVSSVGLMVMRDPFQRLHFIAPPATLSAAFVTVAVAIGSRDPQATFKAGMVAALLLAINGVVTHATARAARARGTRLADGAAPEEP